MSGAEARRRAAAHVIVGPDAGGVAADRLVLDDETAHHLRRVLRLRERDTVTVTDGAGAWRPCRLALPGDGAELLADSEVLVEPRPEPPLTIAAAIPKGDRLEWMVQKVTECGADRIVLLDCDRSVVRWRAERGTRHLARLERIIDEAVRQSRRVWRPELLGPVPASTVLAEAAVAEPGGERLRPVHRSIAVGPEGGWSDAERDMMSLCVELGPHVLRTETAAVVATTLGVALHG